MNVPARILAIAGSDSSGGAGIQADIKTITMLGGYAMTAITAVTAQNTTGVTMVETLSKEMVGAQIDACLTDIGADAVKIGMLGSAAIAHLVADRLDNLTVPVVLDPVMIASSGAVLADEETVRAFERLMRRATVTTPNIPELEALSGMAVPDERAMGEAARHLIARFSAPAILAKGGHWPAGTVFRGHSPAKGGHWPAGTVFRGHSHEDEDLVFDCLYRAEVDGAPPETLFEHARIDTRHNHGTGCTLSSAIATLLGQGLELAEAVGRARDFVRRALLAAPGFGAGYGPMGHQAVR